METEVMLSSDDAKLLTIVIPVRDEEHAIPALRAAVGGIREQLQTLGTPTEVIISDNSSKDRSWILLEEWAREDVGVRCYRLAHDYGFQTSLMFGMRQARGGAVVVLQSDLQDPPALILDFVRAWQAGSRVVAGIAEKRAEGLISRAGRQQFYRALSIASDQSLLRGFQDFYLLDRSVYVPLSRGPMAHQFLRGRIAAEFGVDQLIRYRRSPRLAGKSKFSFAAKYALALDGLLLYSHRFLRAVALMSGVVVASCVAGLLALFLLWIVGVRPAVAGWLSILSVILVLLAIVAGGFALTFEYLVRIYRLTSVDNMVMVTSATAATDARRTARVDLVESSAEDDGDIIPPYSRQAFRGESV